MPPHAPSDPPAADHGADPAAPTTVDTTPPTAADEPGEPPRRRPNLVVVLAGAAVVLLAAILVVIVIVLGAGESGATTRGESVDLARRKAVRDELRAAVDSKRAQLSLPPFRLPGDDADPRQLAAQLGRDAAALAAMLDRYDALLLERDALVAEKNTALVQSEQQRQVLGEALARVQIERDRALVDGSNADLLRRQLEAERSRALELDRQLGEARARLADAAERADPAEVESLKSQLAEARRRSEFFEERATRLEAEIAALREPPPPPPAALFARDENELLPAAVPLFGTLRSLENKGAAELGAAYSDLGAEFGATMVRKVQFPTGSDEIPAGDSDGITSLAASLPDNGMILVLGYASETGNADASRELSSARATAVADAIHTAKQPNQQVQAAFLGQTDRFSDTTPELNQICEVWHILPPAGR